MRFGGGGPKAYLDKVQRRFGLTPNGIKRGVSSEQKQPCPYWSSGDGYCRFAERCHFSHDGPQGGSKKAREFSKGKGNGKGKGRGKGKGKGKNKGKGGRGRTPGTTSLIVKEKSVHYVDEKDKKESSMIVSEEDGAEDKLYNLMRGHTSLMIAADSDDSDDESEDSDNKVDEQDEASSKEEKTRETCIRLYGSASPRKEKPASPKKRDSPEWGSIPAKAPNWETTLCLTAKINNGRMNGERKEGY